MCHGSKASPDPNAWWGLAGAGELEPFRDIAQCPCWTRVGVRDIHNHCLPVGAAAGLSRSIFPPWVQLRFDTHRCKDGVRMNSPSPETTGFGGLILRVTCSSGAVIKSSWSAEPKLCKKTPCLRAFLISLMVSHGPVQRTGDWLTNQPDYLKIHSRNTCFIGTKYSEAPNGLSAELAWRWWIGCPWCHNPADNVQ